MLIEQTFNDNCIRPCSPVLQQFPCLDLSQQFSAANIDVQAGKQASWRVTITTVFRHVLLSEQKGRD
ncbi:hypothetical protein HZH66_001261 [Vespula vulgaris]|uniref:Uncharacterized protein n=1 Tax=Vespula vulgaris TaxID=7454 RepID=A0A834NJE2_VESVU|nr:hypothetical protein HZH66_001261 [Vespula vulgaris]